MSEQNSKSGIMKITSFPPQPHCRSIDLGFLGVLQKDTPLWALLCSLIEMTVGVKGQAMTPPPAPTPLPPTSLRLLKNFMQVVSTVTHYCITIQWKPMV